MIGSIHRFLEKRDLQAFIDSLLTQDAIDIAAMIIIATAYRKYFISLYGIDVYSSSLSANDASFALRELTFTINHTQASHEDVFVKGLMILVHTIRCLTQPSVRFLGGELWHRLSHGFRYVPLLIDDGVILEKLYKQNPSLRLDIRGYEISPIALSDIPDRVFEKTSHIR